MNSNLDALINIFNNLDRALLAFFDSSARPPPGSFDQDSHVLSIQLSMKCRERELRDVFKRNRTRWKNENSRPGHNCRVLVRKRV